MYAQVQDLIRTKKYGQTTIMLNEIDKWWIKIYHFIFYLQMLDKLGI